MTCNRTIRQWIILGCRYKERISRSEGVRRPPETRRGWRWQATKVSTKELRGGGGGLKGVDRRQKSGMYEKNDNCFLSLFRLLHMYNCRHIYLLTHFLFSISLFSVFAKNCPPPMNFRIKLANGKRFVFDSLCIMVRLPRDQTETKP